ncbi:MAG: M23 family metallopeptidase [bacterium]|nr:M23 family metallopeptidase [bacterium]
MKTTVEEESLLSSLSKKLLNNLRRKIKGSLKTPCLCLRIIAVFLLIFVSAGSGLIVKSLAGKNDFYLANISKIIGFEESEKDNLFISPTKGSLPESPEFLLVENSSLKASSPPTTFSSQVLGSLIAGYEPEDVKMVITEYIVESGDTLSSLAVEFNISLDTILWANDLTEKSILKIGQKLVILPVSGVIHHVKSGDTVSGIVETYKGKTEEIVAFNYLLDENDIYVGDIIIVPNGVMPPPPVKLSPAPASVPLADTYFICPHSACRITQGLHWYNAIDFDGKCGDPIYAAAAGQVLKVALTGSTSRWAFGGAGNHITILHPNGVVTMYGHISASLVKPGDRVSQGDRIALMGGQLGTAGAGLSTGCHVHFGVTGARNPFAR